MMGPSLDVLEAPSSESAKDMGTRTFGGDPYWVGEMGRAYIRGVHQGSQNQVAVVAKHFPGHGSSDRLPEEEVATVRKSLEELENFDLSPFFAVTGEASTPEETTDALLSSHLRYQGLQGNIRATTRPVSFDPQAFSLLMALPSLESWRTNGGIMVSDNLGSQAVRSFYDLTSQEFDARRVVLNAFLAGNDLLYVADFTSETETDTFEAAARTVDFFAQKYREDAAFAQRVDESVLRILTLKFRLYSSFTLGLVLSNAAVPEEVGQSGQTTFEVARQGATLISPSLAELDETIPDPPNQSDRLVFITDNRTVKQCSQCPEIPIIETNALQDIVLRRYGPLAGSQVTFNNLSSYSLTDLQKMLETPVDGEVEQEENFLELALSRANWIVFLMLDARPEFPSYQVLKRFLTERPDLFQQKRLIVFAFNAPYYLDATNISKLTAYYGLYSKTPQFVDLAGYLLFRELRPNGASPVSINGISYNLNEALFPDPNQVIPLELDLPQPEVEEGTQTPTPEPTPQLEYRIGDVIPLRVGVILDHNGNPVPDGTPVRFIFTVVGGGEATSMIQEEITQDGIARTTFAINNSGTLEIRAESENARSNDLRFDVPSPGIETATITPTETPTEKPPTPTPTETQVPLIPSNEMPDTPPALTYPGLGDWVVAVLIASAIGWSSYRLSALVGQVRWGVRAGFLALIGGLLAYTYLAFQLPGSELLVQGSLARAIVLTTLFGAALGLLITMSWRAISKSDRSSTTSQRG
jgi:beta-N-acetylhexosaminidase